MDRQSGFGAPANLADWPRQGSNPGSNRFRGEKAIQTGFAGAHPAHQWTQCPI